MRVGVSTHIHVYKNLSAELLADIAGAGFESVELYCNHPHWNTFDRKEERERIVRACGDFGLAINSIHTPFFATIEDARRGVWYSLTTKNKALRRESIGRIIDSLAVAENAQVRAAVVHVGGSGEEENGGTWDRLYYGLEEILPVAKEVGVTLALENITNDFSRGYRIAGFIEESGLGGVCCCYDCGHATLYDRTVEELKEMAPHLTTTHIHDTTDGKDNHLPPFAGDIDWEALADAFAGTEYDGDLIIETKDPDSSLEMLERCAAAGERLHGMISRKRDQK